MAWQDVVTIETELKAALDSYDWIEARRIVTGVIARIRQDQEIMPLPVARGLVDLLRGKRQLGLVAALAEALLESGQREVVFQRQYAQAMIDLGYLSPAEYMLRGLVQSALGTKEEHEARGLLGRIYKQTYVNQQLDEPKLHREKLLRAIGEYSYCYSLDSTKHLWHGINVVALLQRAQRDRIKVPGMVDPQTLASEIIETLHTKERDEKLSIWDLAIAMEAHVALGKEAEAFDRLRQYVLEAGVDAFELNSTLRQLTEVWGLGTASPIGERILPLLRASLVAKEGSRLQVSAADARADKDNSVKLEAVFDGARFQTIKSYRLGLTRAESVARIERPGGQGHGTGWLVDGNDFFPGKNHGKLLVTNYHVVSDQPSLTAIPSSQARINFQTLCSDKRLSVERVVWWSREEEYDATFLKVRDVPDTLRPLELSDATPAGDARLYLIGHPQGRDLEFSIEDSRISGMSEKYLYYRTPTDVGSSGSPVFENQEWKVVALHHATRRDKTGNEGILIQTLRKVTAQAQG